MSEFSWKHPDYMPLLTERQRKLARLRRDPSMIPVLREFYKRNLAQWVQDHCCTFDPRNPERQIPSLTPFPLMPFQIRWLNFQLSCWRQQLNNLTEKSREQGLSWLAVCFAVWLCVFHEGVSCGFGSYKAELVDELGNADSLLEKMRILLRNLPAEFRGGWTEENSKRNQIDFPETRSSVIGQTGDNIGRGGRKSWFCCDESAHFERPLLIDASLAATTNCRADISSVFGQGNPFAEKVREGKMPVFRATWREDLRKDAEWERQMRIKVGDTIFAQEYDADYMAGVDGQLIPGHWLAACVDAHVKLGIVPTGRLRAGFDIATAGRDLNSLAIRHGVVLRHSSAWKQESVKQSSQRVVRELAKFSCTELDFDAVGVGDTAWEFVRDAAAAAKQTVRTNPFKASEAPENPAKCFPGTSNTNEDTFANKAAQGGWHLRWLVENTYRAVNGDTSVSHYEIFSIDSSTVEDIGTLLAHMSQPIYEINSAGKITLDKSPGSAKSPDRYDAVMMAFAPKKSHVIMPQAAIDSAMRASPAPWSNAAMFGHMVGRPGM
jgi:phage terminase large subunit